MNRNAGSGSTKNTEGTKGSAGFQPVLAGILPASDAPLRMQRAAQEPHRTGQRQDAVADGLEDRAPLFSNDSADRMAFEDLAFVVLQQVRAVAVQHARPAAV